MAKSIVEKDSTLDQLIDQELKPYVKKIDVDAFYAESFLKKLGEAGFLSSTDKSQKQLLLDEMYVVEKVARTCMTTAFCLWCHLAALTYVRKTDNDKLKNQLLPSLEKGEILGGTGLSNPMKYYGGLEKLHLTATPTEGGFLLSGVLPSVSNLGDGHWFGVIAGVDEMNRMMCCVPCEAEGLVLKEKVNYLGINGSATYACSFKEVFIPEEWILSKDADGFIDKIRPAFISYQIPLGAGVTQASISSIEKVGQKQNGCNRYLQTQSEELQEKEDRLQEKIATLFDREPFDWKQIAQVRLDAVYLALDSVQASMLHNGSAGYIRDSAPSRRLREAYFFANLTPTVKHLEKVLST